MVWCGDRRQVGLLEMRGTVLTFVCKLSIHILACKASGFKIPRQRCVVCRNYKYSSKLLYEPKIKSKKELLPSPSAHERVLVYIWKEPLHRFAHFYEVPNNDYRV